MFYAVEILSHKKPLGVPWICGVYDARSKLPVGACAILARRARVPRTVSSKWVIVTYFDDAVRSVCMCVGLKRGSGPF